jgi:hypothetical protein
VSDTLVTRLIGVYAADGGLRGELSYLAGRYLQGRHCELCDITHSPIRRRKAWDDFTSSLNVPFDLVHRNERDDLLLAATAGAEPCVAAQTLPGRIHVVLPAQTLAQVSSVADFADALISGLREHHLQIPAEPSAPDSA